MSTVYSWFFFFQAEDGIRDTSVTGVQTCALPISSTNMRNVAPSNVTARCVHVLSGSADEIGRASCRERVTDTVVGVALLTSERDAKSWDCTMDLTQLVS